MTWYVGCAASSSRLFTGSLSLFIVEKATRLPENTAIVVKIKSQWQEVNIVDAFSCGGWLLPEMLQDYVLKNDRLWLKNHHRGRIQIGIWTRCLDKGYWLLMIYRIKVWKMALMFPFYINLNIIVLANIW